MEHAGSPNPSTCADKWPPHRVDNVLSFAAREQWDCVGSALDAGFPVNAAGTSGPKSLLHSAARHGCMPMVRRLLALGAHVDVRGRYQQTPTHYAAICGRVDVLVALVEAGADVNARDRFLDTPLHKAVLYSLPCTRYLLSLPLVDLSTTNRFGKTVEDNAILYGQPAAADAVRAEVRAASGHCGDSSAAAARHRRHVWLLPTARPCKASFCNTLSCVLSCRACVL